MIAIVDYGVGNLFSLKSSLDFIGAQNVITNDADVIKNADKIILPGVGAFADAIKLLHQTGLVPVLKQQVSQGKPLLGICLGMQLLFENSFEYGCHKGLGFIKGDVCPIADDVDKTLKISHMGWNSLDIKKQSPLFKYIKDGDYVYFVHSYYAKNCNDVIATSNYGIDLTAMVQNGNVFGAQFHPEKSGETGLAILKAFNEI
ncbi:MAG: imidazole glycerol phosphate synthase subunit HisH [Clostridia bacterium]|nr:imidazole glycerol phosphate synthase subunit HisH [Clostridia bacterium]